MLLKAVSTSAGISRDSRENAIGTILGTADRTRSTLLYGIPNPGGVVLREDPQPDKTSAPRYIKNEPRSYLPLPIIHTPRCCYRLCLIQISSTLSGRTEESEEQLNQENRQWLPFCSPLSILHRISLRSGNARLAGDKPNS